MHTHRFVPHTLVVLQVSYLVLDEADKLLAMGFAEQVDALLAAASNPHITRALFSATLPDKVGCLVGESYASWELLPCPDEQACRVPLGRLRAQGWS